jgi:SagB-type dehydrogenase family enzyme
MSGSIRDPNPADEFHRRTKITPPGWVQEEQALPAAGQEPVLLWTPLPAVAISSGPSLEEAICRRHTSRTFDPRASLPAGLLARLLVLSCGRTATTCTADGPRPSGHRAIPSAGARYPVELRLAALRVAGLGTGIYTYDPVGHSLGLIRPGAFGPLIAGWCLDQFWMAGAAVVFALVADPGRVEDRYGSRGYRYVLLEAGHIAQNLYLLGAGYGLSVQATGGFVDDALSRLFGLGDTRRHVVYVIAVGLGS